MMSGMLLQNYSVQQGKVGSDRDRDKIGREMNIVDGK